MLKIYFPRGGKGGGFSSRSVKSAVVEPRSKRNPGKADFLKATYVDQEKEFMYVPMGCKPVCTLYLVLVTLHKYFTR